MIASLELELQVLSGLMNNPEAYPEISGVLRADDFSSDVNETIFRLIKKTIEDRDHLDKVVLGVKLTELSIGFKDDINPIDYVDSICLNKASYKVLLQSVKELKAMSLRRTCSEMGTQIVRTMKKSTEWKPQEVISYIDKLVYKELENWNSETDVIDLFDNLYYEIEERGNNPKEEVGIMSPYPEFNRLYGGYTPGDVYIFCARAGDGKSTYLTNTAFKMANLHGQKIPCLVLDTEMGQSEAIDVKCRLAASLTGINPWYFKSGAWRKDPTMTRIIREDKVDGKTLKERMESYSLHYRYLTDASIDNIVSTIKKWYYTTVGRGNPCIIVYDYIKVSGGDMGNQMKEYQLLGEKVNRLKELVGEEVNAPLLTAAQLNRLGDNRSKEQNDTSSAIAGSDRLLHFCTYCGIFRRKTLEEISEETDQYGTHKLITLKSRNQGRDASGHNVFVKKPDGKVSYNFLNYTISDFNVTEKGCAEDMYAAMPNQKGVDFEKGNDLTNKPAKSKVEKKVNPFDDA